MTETIRFNHPSIEGREMDYIREAVDGGHTSSSGPFSQRVVELLREAHPGAADVLLTTSCTDALEMSAMLLEAQPGDTVIVPSFTFVSTALAYVREGFRIVFADIETETLGIDPDHVASLVDDTTRAVVVVHYAGIGADMDGLDTALGDRPVDVIEDNAHGLFATRGSRSLGTFGRLSTLSFHETKNFVCGEGGALVVNDERDVARAHVLHDKGTNRRAFMLGQVDKYSWQDTGSSFGLSDINAAYLLGQLEARDAVMDKRRRVFEAYEQRLAGHVDEFGLRLPVVPEGNAPGYHMFYVLLPDRAARDHVLGYLRERGVQATFHYVPLHSSRGGRRFAASPTDCPNTDQISGRLLRLPFHNRLTEADVDRVVDTFVAALSGS
jgi:dTDP-4-amino-4,6-dideoxygalactose transaminase